MPAIASLEDLKAVQNDVRSMFLAVFPLQLTPHALRFTLRRVRGDKVSEEQNK